MVHSAVATLLSRLRRENFQPKLLGVLTNPFFITRRALFREISAIAPLVSGQVMDFGCGSKPYESLFLNASSYVGIDTKSSGHDHTHSRVDVFFDGLEVPFPSESFDCVVSFEVVEHLFEIRESLMEIFRVVRPGGIVVFSAPFAWEETEPPFDFARYTVFGLRHCFEAVGFKVLRQEKTTSTYLATRQIVIASRLRMFGQFKSPVARGLFQLCLVAPWTIWSLILDRIVPEDGALYGNQLLIAEKPPLGQARE